MTTFGRTHTTADAEDDESNHDETNNQNDGDVAHAAGGGGGGPAVFKRVVATLCRFGVCGARLEAVSASISCVTIERAPSASLVICTRCPDFTAGSFLTGLIGSAGSHLS